MARKTLLSAVPDSASPEAGPARPLGIHGMALWNTVMSEYRIEDCGGREMLTSACQALDRAEALRDRIDEDGEIIATPSGLKEHPALRHELAARSFIVRTLHRLGLDVEPLRSVGHPTRKVGAWTPVA